MNPIQNTTLTSALWETVRDEIHDLDRFGPDWDGEGAEPVPQELIFTTIRFCKILEENGYLAPIGSIYALPDGTVMVECAHQCGVTLSANIRESWQIELLYKAPGEEPEFEVFSMQLDPSDTACPSGQTNGYGMPFGDDPVFAMAA